MRRNVVVVGLVCGMLAASPPAWSQPGVPSAPVRTRQLWAIIVGVGSPLDPRARAQSSGEVVQQAFNVLKWLNGTAGWNRSHLLLLTDLDGSADPGSLRSPASNITPTRKNLDWAFRQWLPARAQAGDLVVFYFAGQARAVTGGDPLAPPEYYLLPSDVLLDNLPARGWSLDGALDETARQGKYQIVCWLGTTLQLLQSPGAGPRRPRDLARLNRDWIRRAARWPGVTVWLAADHPPATPSADSAATFTGAVLGGQGTKDRKQNLAACLRTLQGVSKLKVEGFQAIGGVPPDLTLWADQLGPPLPPPRPEMVLQVGHADRVAEIVSTPDSRLVITASQDSTIRVWAPGQKGLLRVLTGHSVGATALALSRDGK